MNIKTFSLFAIIAAVVAGVLRVLQFAFFFNSETGFFSDKGLLSWIALAIMLAVTLFAVVKIFTDKKFYGRIAFGRSTLTAFVSVVAALLTAAGAKLLFDDWAAVKSGQLVEVSATGLSMRAPFFYATVVLALFFICSAVLWGIGRNLFEKTKLVYLVSVIWAIFLILYVFIHYSISILTTENIFVIISACCTAVAFMAQARFFSEINDDGKALRTAVPATAAAAMLLLSYSASDLVIYYMGIHPKGEISPSLMFIMLAAGIYMAVILVELKYNTVAAPVKDKNTGGTRFKIDKKQD